MGTGGSRSLLEYSRREVMRQLDQGVSDEEGGELQIHNNTF